MKNSDMPAMPSDIDAQTFGELFSSDFRELTKYRSGMTKRETIAMHLMQGILSAGDADGFVFGDEVGFAGFAVSCADALLAELDRTQTP
jgi:hypothetical protein